MFVPYITVFVTYVLLFILLLLVLSINHLQTRQKLTRHQFMIEKDYDRQFFHILSYFHIDDFGASIIDMIQFFLVNFSEN